MALDPQSSADAPVREQDTPPSSPTSSTPELRALGPITTLLDLADEEADERALLDVATQAVTERLGERGAALLVDGKARVALATSNPALRDLPIDLGRYPEVGLAIALHRTIVVEDAQNDARMAPVRALIPSWLRTVVAVPLVASERCLGVLLVQSTTLRKAAPGELAAARAIARLVAHLIEGARRRTAASLVIEAAQPRPGEEATQRRHKVAIGAEEWLRTTQRREPRPSTASLLPRRVLVIEDEPEHAQIVKAVLERASYEVDLTYDGQEGLERAQATPPDIVLLDVLLPALDGFHVAERLKQEARTRDVPILFLSACDGLTARVRGLELGAADYLPKPFYAQELLARVERSLRQAESRAELRTQAQLDELTGLGNLRFLRQRIAVEQARAERTGASIAMVMIDVDKLKRINDELGHAAGSRALADIGRVLRDETREADVAVRYGGDEFCVLLARATVDDALRFADRVLARIRALRVGTEEWPLAASVGVSASSQGERRSVEQLLEEADAAAYRAKRAGGNRVCAFDERPAKATETAAALAALASSENGPH